MAEINPPSWMQGRTDHKAQQYRRMLAAAMADKAGIVYAGDLLVTQNGTPNMSVNVATGRVFVAGSQGTYQGLYLCDNQGTKNITISAAHATNPRYDRIVAKVEDAEYAGAVNAWSLAVVEGTPAASPTEPALPANSVELARVQVDAGVTSITNSAIVDRRLTSAKGRAAALGGIAVTTSAARPTANLSEGQVIYETDTDKFLWYTGTDWLGFNTAAGQLAYKATGADQTGIQTTSVDVTGLSATVTMTAGRRVELVAAVGLYKNAPDTAGWAAVQITDGSNTVLAERNTVLTAPGYGSVLVRVRVNPSTGSNTWKVRANTNAGFVNVSSGANFSVDDVGSSTMPA